jgi:cell division protein FtsW
VGLAGTFGGARAGVGRLFDRQLTSYYLLIGATVLLITVGMAEVFSVSTLDNLINHQPLLSTFERQLIGALLGLPLMWIASRLPPRVYRALAYPMLIITIVLLVLVLAVGHTNNGNQNWLIFGPIILQPSEFAKLSLLLWGADLLVRKEKSLTQWNHLLVPLLPVAALIVGLIMLGGDMGTSVIVVAIVLSMLWVAGAPLRLFSSTLFVTLFLAASAVALRPSRIRRFATFLNPTADPQGTGYQALHSFSALSSGGLFGVGLGASREKWGQLPAAQTDFIFAIIGEELGLFGALTVLALLMLIGYAGIRIALRTDDMFVRLVAGAVTTWLMTQALINLGAVLGVLPIAGVPLPFVSYGGSSLLPAMFSIGILLSFARRRRVPVTVRAGGSGQVRQPVPAGAGMLRAGRTVGSERERS